VEEFDLEANPILAPIVTVRAARAADPGEFDRLPDFVSADR
jgi:hypothetical protein